MLFYTWHFIFFTAHPVTVCGGLTQFYFQERRRRPTTITTHRYTIRSGDHYGLKDGSGHTHTHTTNTHTLVETALGQRGRKCQSESESFRVYRPFGTPRAKPKYKPISSLRRNTNSSSCFRRYTSYFTPLLTLLLIIVIQWNVVVNKTDSNTRERICQKKIPKQLLAPSQFKLHFFQLASTSSAPYVTLRETW